MKDHRDRGHRSVPIKTFQGTKRKRKTRRCDKWVVERKCKRFFHSYSKESTVDRIGESNTLTYIKNEKTMLKSLKRLLSPLVTYISQVT